MKVHSFISIPHRESGLLNKSGAIVLYLHIILIHNTKIETITLGSSVFEMEIFSLFLRFKAECFNSHQNLKSSSPLWSVGHPQNLLVVIRIFSTI